MHFFQGALSRRLHYGAPPRYVAMPNLIDEPGALQTSIFIVEHRFILASAKIWIEYLHSHSVCVTREYIVGLEGVIVVDSQPLEEISRKSGTKVGKNIAFYLQSLA